MAQSPIGTFKDIDNTVTGSGFDWRSRICPSAFQLGERLPVGQTKTGAGGAILAQGGALAG